MISLFTLAEAIKTKLNNGLSGYKFEIGVDTTEFKKAIRNGNEVPDLVNGLLTSVSSSVSNLTDGNVVALQTCHLGLIFRLEDTEQDTDTIINGEVVDTIAGYKTRLRDLRTALDKVFQENETSLISDGEKMFVVSSVYELASSGLRDISDEIGDSFSYDLNIYYTFVENGINTRNNTLLIDGVLVPYQSITTSRIPTIDANVYANTTDGATKNLTSQTTLSINIELPALDNSVMTDNILDFILTGEMNKAHLLTYSVGAKTHNYLVGFVQTRIMGANIQNIGQNIELGEVPDDYDLITFGKNYHIYENTTKIPVGTIISLGDNAQTFIFSNTGNRFLSIETGLFRAPDDFGYFIVTTKELKGVAGGSVLQYFTKVQ